MIEGSSLSAHELAIIIKTCGAHRVARLKLGGLELEFLPRAEVVNTLAPGPALPVLAPETVTQEQNIIQNEVIETAELETRERQMAELWLTDPLEAEELLENGDADSTDGEDDGSVD